jgi:glutathione S-transferase
MLKIWGRGAAPNVQKVVWACEELDIEYSRTDIGGPFGGLTDPTYLKKNPNGLIPTIEDGDFVLWESNAILRYLARRHPEHQLYPTDISAAAKIDQWLDWQMVALGLRIRSLFLVHHRPEGAPGETIASASENAEKSFRIIEEQLAKHCYVAGEAFTIADIAVGISTHRWLQFPIKRPAMPAVERWFSAVTNRPAFAHIAALPFK